MTKERYDDLINNKWNHDIILHEAGVPPIHTFLFLFDLLFIKGQCKFYKK